jgi:hypothetical protein
LDGERAIAVIATTRGNAPYFLIRIRKEIQISRIKPVHLDK